MSDAVKEILQTILEILVNIYNAIVHSPEEILSWFHDIIDNMYQSIIYEFYMKITIIFSAIANFVLDVFDDCGSKVVGFGDLLANAFSRNGFNSFNNFFYAFIGIIFIVFCIKTGIKLILKLIDIVGNYIPFT